MQVIEVCISTSHMNGGMYQCAVHAPKLKCRRIDAGRIEAKIGAIEGAQSKGAHLYVRMHERSPKSYIKLFSCSDDILRAIDKLKVLGGGFELIPMGGGRYLVQSVPGELNMDHTRVLQLAEVLKL